MTDSTNTTEMTRDVREIAADWHGGQWSPLYAFASTGTMTDGLAREIRECIAETKAHRACYVERDRRELATLLAHVERHGHLAQARCLGADAALAAASWIEMSESDARSILGDVDPMVLDRYPEPNLSGEWAGESIPEIFCDFDDPHDPALHDAWEEGRDAVWPDALQAHALRVLGDIPKALQLEQANESYVDSLRSAAR